MNFAVTTGRNCQDNLLEEAQIWASQLQSEYIPRKQYGKLETLLQEKQLDAVLVAAADGPRIVNSGGTFFYHPSMAVLRIQRLKNGENDNFAAALNIHKGMKILDATLGLASDAAIASYLVGDSGKVIGLEASRLLWFVVSKGLQTYTAEDSDLTEALRRIETVQMNAADYLQQCVKDAFDAVYFDPMFRFPVSGSSAMQVLRPIAYVQPLTLHTVQLALEAAPMVVIKERSEKILREYGCTEICGGRYSKVKYGIIRR